MKLTLFSQNVTNAHKEKIKTLFKKPLDDVKFLYINTAGNYKPYKKEWMISSEREWQSIFKNFQEFDLERAYRVDSNFDFKSFFSNYDYIYFSGGNTFLLSYWLKKTNTLELLKELIVSDKIVYGGTSAGAIICSKDISWTESADDPNQVPERVDEGLGIIDFTPMPHWDNPEFKPILEKAKEELQYKGINIKTYRDNQAIFVDDQSIEII